MARQLSVVPAPAAGPEVLATVEPAVRACLDGGAPLAVLPTGPAAAVEAGPHGGLDALEDRAAGRGGHEDEVPGHERTAYG